MSYKLGNDDYRAIALEAADPAAKPARVKAAEYDEMLGIMPPIYVKGGFLVCEPITHSELGAVYAMYAERGGQFYGKYVVLGAPQTYIS